MKKQSNFLLFLLLFVGCVNEYPLVSPLVTGIIKWKEGEAHKYYPNNSEIVFGATKRACQKFQYNFQYLGYKNNSFVIIAGNKERFKIKIRTVEPDISELNIRVNFMGDKPYAELLYREVDEQLNVIEFKNGIRTPQKAIFSQ